MSKSAKVEELNEVQVEFHKLLENFLNGYTLDYKSKLLYPIIDQNLIPNDLLDRVSFFKKELPETNKYLENIKTIKNAYSIARLIAIFYSEFYGIKFKGTKERSILIERHFNEWQEKAKHLKNKKLGIIKRVRNFVDKNIKSYLIDFFIHGSFSTLDYTKWSDSDLLIILKKDVITDANKLLSLRRKVIKLNKYLFYNDPLQHHGLFVICEQEMGYYCQSFFPIELFGYSTPFFGCKSLTFNIRDSKKEAIDDLNELIEYVVNFSKKSKISLYDWKLFCHTILLIPTIYLETKGIYIYKKFSFEKARKEFRGDEWSVIDKMTEIRNNFYFKPWWTELFLKFTPLYWHLVILLRLFTKGPNITDIKESSLEFVNAVKRKVRI